MINNHTYSILAIDDEEIVLETIEGFLSLEGHKVFCTNSGQKALAALADQHFDLVLTDLQMPNMGGLEILQKVKNYNQDLPVIIISGAGELNDSIEALRAGAWDYLLKPIDFPLLINSISRACERTRLLTENRHHRENLEEQILLRTTELHNRTEELERINYQLLKEIENRKKVEEKKRQLEKEIQKSRHLESLGNLAGGIAHDFNNLLSALAGYIDFAKIDCADNPKVTDALNSAKVVTKMAADLTKQLLTFSKGGQPLIKEVRVNELIHEAISLCPHSIDKISFVTSVPKFLWDAKVDRNQLSIVLRNIFFNAIESMPEGGVIRTSAKNCALDENNNFHLEPGTYILITISDCGDGIIAKDLKRIFDPYFTTKGMDSKKGKGLGLTVSYSIIKKHDGHIAITSKPGKGTNVSIYIPASKKD